MYVFVEHIHTVEETQEGSLWDNSIPMFSEDQVEKMRKPK